MKRALGLLALAGLAAFGASAGASGSLSKGDCTFNGKKLFGRIQIVTSFPDVKVQEVSSFPDVKVQRVDSFPDRCGKWQLVTSFPDTKVQVVSSFPDVRIQYVSSFPGVK